jgi:hypothetical protein
MRQMEESPATTPSSPLPGMPFPQSSHVERE